MAWKYRARGNHRPSQGGALARSTTESTSQPTRRSYTASSNHVGQGSSKQVAYQLNTLKYINSGQPPASGTAESTFSMETKPECFQVSCELVTAKPNRFQSHRFQKEDSSTQVICPSKSMGLKCAFLWLGHTVREMPKDWKMHAIPSSQPAMCGSGKTPNLDTGIKYLAIQMN